MADFLDTITNIASIEPLVIFIDSMMAHPTDKRYMLVKFRYVHPDYGVVVVYGGEKPKAAKANLLDISYEIQSAYRINPVSVIGMQAIARWTSSGLSKVRITEAGRAHLAATLDDKKAMGTIKRACLRKMTRFSYRMTIPPYADKSNEKAYGYKLDMLSEDGREFACCADITDIDFDLIGYGAPKTIEHAKMHDAYGEQITINTWVYYIQLSSSKFKSATIIDIADAQMHVLTSLPQVVGVRPEGTSIISRDYFRRLQAGQVKQPTTVWPLVSLPTRDAKNRPVKCVAMQAVRAIDGDTIATTQLFTECYAASAAEKEALLQSLRSVYPDAQESNSIRIAGINAPEYKVYDRDYTKWENQEGAQQAYNLVQSMLDMSDGHFYFALDKGLGYNGFDKYGRPLGEVFIPQVDETGRKTGQYYNLGLMLLAMGMADPMLFTQGGKWTALVACQSEYERYAKQGKRLYEQHAHPWQSDMWEPKFIEAEPFEWYDLDDVHGELPENGMRIGDVQFIVPPTAIRVQRVSETTRLPLMRSRSTVKKTTGHVKTVIEIDLYFHDVESINGRVYEETRYKGNSNINRFYHIDGLRALIAQFKRTPFVPIENTLLNAGYDIWAVTFLSLQVGTVPGFPGSLHAELTLLPFNHNVFLYDSIFFSESIIWPLFRDYYQRAIVDGTADMWSRLPADSKLRLCAVPSTGVRNECTFYAATEQNARNIAASKSLKAQISYLLAGNSPNTDFQRQFAASLGMKKAMDNYAFYQRTRGTKEECLEQYWQYIKDKATGLALKDATLYNMMRRDDMQLAKGSSMSGLSSSIDNIEQIYDYYRTIGYFPWYRPRVFSQLRKKVQYLDSPYLDGKLLCDVFILELEGTSYAHVPGIVRLYLYNEQTKQYVPSPFYLVPAQRMKEVAAYYRDPREWSTQISEQVARAEQELIFDMSFIPHQEDLVMTSFVIAMNNVVVDMPASSEEYGAHQYLGSMDTVIRIVFETTSFQAVRELDSLVTHVNNLSRQYRYGMESGFMLIRNDLAQLFGVNSVIVDSITIHTVDGQPGLYRIEMVLTAFERAQRDIEELDALLDSPEELTTLQHRGSPEEYARFKVFEDRMRERSAYPDLELPTYDEVNTLMAELVKSKSYYNEIDKWSIRGPRPDVVYSKAHVDPDFYVCHGTSFKQRLKSTLDGKVNLDLYSLTTGEAVRLKDATLNYKNLVPLVPTANELQQIQPTSKVKHFAYGPVPLDTSPPIAGCTDSKCNHTLRKLYQDPDTNLSTTDEKFIPLRISGADVDAIVYEGLEDYTSAVWYSTNASKTAPLQAYIYLYTASTSEANPEGLTQENQAIPNGKLYKSMHTAKAASKYLPLGTIFRICDPHYMAQPNGGYYVVEETIESGDNLQANIDGIPVVGLFVVSLDSVESVIYREPLEIAILGRVRFDATRRDHEDCRQAFNAIMPCARKQFLDEVAQSGDEALAFTGAGRYYGLPSNPAEAALVDMCRYDCRGRLVRAFPTYRLFFIDEGPWVKNWRLVDNYYGLNAVLAIDLYSSRKAVASTCILHLGNTYGHLTTMQYKDALPVNAPAMLWKYLTLNPEDIEFQSLLAYRAQSVETIFMRPGARIQLRMGYGSDISALPVVFNGTITEFTPGDIVKIVAQSDGLELTNPTKGGVIKAESSKRIRQIMMGDMTGLEKTTYGISKGWIDPRANPIKHFGEPTFYQDNPFYATGEMTHNVYIGAGVAKLREAPDGWAEWVGALSSYVSIIFAGAIPGLEDYYDELNIGINETGKTAWDVFQSHAACMPDYIAAVVPFEQRSTLFFGRPSWLLRYEYTERGTLRQKTFWQMRFYHSATDILSNGIYVSADGVYNNVQLRYNTKSQNEKQTTGSSVTVHADTDIAPEEQRTAVIVSDLMTKVPIFSNVPGLKALWEAPAYNYATTVLVNFMKDMYKGPLLVIGDPTVKPHDPCYIFDQYNQMHGLFQVKEVAHHMSQEMGFVTSIVPDCCVAATNGEMAQWWTMLGAVGASTMTTLTAITTLSIAATASKRAIVARQAGKLAKAAAKPAVEGALGALKHNIVALRSKIWQATNTWFTVGAGTALWVSTIINLAITAVVIIVVEGIVRDIGYKARARQAVVVAPLRQHNSNLTVLLKGSKGAVVGSLQSSRDTKWATAVRWLGQDVQYQFKSDMPYMDWVDMADVSWAADHDMLYNVFAGTSSSLEELQITDLSSFGKKKTYKPSQQRNIAPDFYGTPDSSEAQAFSPVSGGITYTDSLPFSDRVQVDNLLLIDDIAKYSDNSTVFGYSKIAAIQRPALSNIEQYRADMAFIKKKLSNKPEWLAALDHWQGFWYLAGYTHNQKAGHYVAWHVTIEDIVTLIAVMYAECRGEPYPGQILVASVILNRVFNNFAKFSTQEMRFMAYTPGYSPLALTIYQPGQFDPVRQSNWQKHLESAIAIAQSTSHELMKAIAAAFYKEALQPIGSAPYPGIIDATFFLNPATSSPRGVAEHFGRWIYGPNGKRISTPAQVPAEYTRFFGAHCFGRELTPGSVRPTLTELLRADNNRLRRSVWAPVYWVKLPPMHDRMSPYPYRLPINKSDFIGYGTPGKEEYWAQSQWKHIRSTGSSGSGAQQRRYHKGFDVRGRLGANIYPMLDGIVVQVGTETNSAGEMAGYGHYVIVKHEILDQSFGIYLAPHWTLGTWYSLYAHCDKLHVTAGVPVTVNQPIAQLGVTGHGNKSNPHVHWEVFFVPHNVGSTYRLCPDSKYRYYVDPILFLAAIQHNLANPQGLGGLCYMRAEQLHQVYF
ncbi:MAG TPA: peptidoglycan DD-metalloendopeptidase family protein [Corynebacteriales bacterium]|nr:peptidoglycan DD-metalloendopeptidase family protein [Mycobacteriales bacterium]